MEAVDCVSATPEDVRDICAQADVQSPGIYRTVETHLTVAFVEPNPFRMDYRWQGTIEAVTPMRFFEQHSPWSGKGVAGPPKITAELNGRKLVAGRRGAIYRSGQFEKYLIDLGEDVPAGSLVNIHTESRCVDEAATPETSLSTIGRPSFQALSLTVESVKEIDGCRYVHSTEDGDDVINEAIDPTHGDGLFIYSKSVSPAVLGTHRLIWSWRRW